MTFHMYGIEKKAARAAPVDNIWKTVDNIVCMWITG